MTDSSPDDLKNITPAGYEDLIKALNLAVIQYTMYPHEHILAKGALETAYNSLTEALKDKKDLIFGIVENRLLVEDAVLNDAVSLIARFFDNFKKLKIDSLTFSAGITKQELSSLIAVMAMREDTIEASGGAKKLLASNATPNIKLENVRYERVGEGETVVSLEDGEKIVKVSEGERLVVEKADEHKVQKQPFYKTMLRYLKGEIKNLKSEVDEKKLLAELTKNPKRTVTLLLEVGREIRNLQFVVERLGDWLADLVHREGSSLKKDISQVMAIFGKRLQEELLSSGKTTESLKTSETLGTIVSQYVDRIKVDMITSKFKMSKKKSPKELERIMGKVVQSKDEMDRILPQLSTRLQGSGVLSDAEFNDAIKRVKETPLKEKKVEISEVELRRLYELEKIARGKQVRPVPAKKETAKMPQAVSEDTDPGKEKTGEKSNAPEEGKQAIIKSDEVVVSRQELERLRHGFHGFEDEIASRVKAATKHLAERNRELSADLERQYTLLHECSSGIIVVDREDKVILMNRAAEELLGVPKEKMIGHYILDQLREEHLLALTRRKEFSSDKTIKQVEVSAVNSGTRDTIKASTAVVEDEDGKTIGMLFVLTDVIKQRELEEIKKNFLSRVSIHLLGPATSIRDNLIVLLNQTAGDLNEEQKRLVSMGRDNVEHLARTIGELLIASEIRKKELKLNLTRFDLVSLIETSITGFQRFAVEKKISIKKELPKTTLEINADREKVFMVLDSLIANGLKAASNGGEVTIGTGPYIDEQQMKTGFVLVYVADTGSGIPASEIDEIFDEFYNAGINDEKFSGLGLGLSSAKEIINMHGGKIWVETRRGKGSKFSLILPVK
ncbi:MAG: cell wall metabolism sensor histidine kinase WalK [Candidatus Omnitrophica bacterium]|nr:cell wall metabolism sensor histidine kinase WalK [Candidatus Omnitrophota bacterium]MBU1933084.1 cell wall metabolism sensor histidine kinase WalK [Candidatus Omnitrophota bacterium]